MQTDNPTNPVPIPELTPQHEQLVWQLRLRGWNQERIALHLGVDQDTISQMIKRIRIKLAAEYADGMAEIIAVQTQHLLHIVNEALDAWQQSRGAACCAQQPQPPAPTPHQEEPAGQTSEPHNPVNTENPVNPGSDNQSPPSPRGGNSQSEFGLLEERPIRGQGGEVPGKPAYLRVALQALNSLRALWNSKAAQEEEELPYADYPQKILVGIDMERFRNGLGAPEEDTTMQPTCA